MEHKYWLTLITTAHVHNDIVIPVYVQVTLVTIHTDTRRQVVLDVAGMTVTAEGTNWVGAVGMGTTRVGVTFI